MKNYFDSSVLLVALFVFLFSCEQSVDKELTPGKITFGFPGNVDGRVAEGFNPKAILISVVNANGVSIANLKRMELYNFSGSYLTNEELELLPGSYSITQLLVVDESNAVTHVLPVEGSQHAHLVEDAAPIHFSVGSGEHKTQTIQVVEVEGSANEYGYVTFEVDEIPTNASLVSVYFESTQSIQFAEVRFSNGSINISVPFDQLFIQHYQALVEVPLGDWSIEIIARYENQLLSTWYGNPDWGSNIQPFENNENLGAFKYKSTITILSPQESINAGMTMSSNGWTDYFYKRLLPDQDVELYFNKDSWENFLEVELHPSVNLKYLYVDKSVHWTTYDGSEYQSQLLETWSICDTGYNYGQCEETISGKRKFTFSIPKVSKLNDINCHDMYFYFEKIDSQGQSIWSGEGLVFCSELW